MIDLDLLGPTATPSRLGEACEQTGIPIHKARAFLRLVDDWPFRDREALFQAVRRPQTRRRRTTKGGTGT